MDAVNIEAACPHCSAPNVVLEYDEDDPRQDEMWVSCAACGAQAKVEMWRRACVAAVILGEYEQSAHGRLRVEKMMGRTDLIGGLNPDEEEEQ